MSFLTRFGIGLLLFGILTLVAQTFGYTPRKLASLSPAQLRVAGVVFTALGGVCLACGGSPRLRKGILVSVASIVGLGAVLVVAALLYGRYGRSSYKAPPPSSAPPPGWTPPPPSQADAGPKPPESPDATGPKSPMAAFHEKSRLLETRLGREQVWRLVVHLGGREPPADLQARLERLVAGKATGAGAAVARQGGLQQAVLGPLADAGDLRAALAGLFPGAEIQVMAPARQCVVFVR